MFKVPSVELGRPIVFDCEEVIALVVSVGLSCEVIVVTELENGVNAENPLIGSLLSLRKELCGLSGRPFPFEMLDVVILVERVKVPP